MQNLIRASAKNGRKSQLQGMSALALRCFVLSIVDRLQQGALPEKLWSSQEDGVEMIEEILLEGRACGIESQDGFEELCRTVVTCKIPLPFPPQLYQALTRPELNEMQRIESLRQLYGSRDASRSNLPEVSCS